MALKDIEICSESMLTLAKKNRWEDFLTKLHERERMIAAYQNKQSKNSKNNDDIQIVSRLNTLNEELLALSQAHQDEIQNQLIKLFKKTTVTKAYSSR